MANQIIEVPDIAVVKTISGAKQLLSLRDQKIVKEKALVDIGVGSGIKYEGDLYVLKSEKIVPEGELIVTTTTMKANFSFVLWPIIDIMVDWGDGVIEKNVFSHTYTDGASSHNIKVYGDTNMVYTANFGGCMLMSLSVDNSTSLTHLQCQTNQLTSLDVSKNTALDYLSCYDNPVISDQPALTALANSLPDRTGETAGKLRIYDSTSAAWIKDICTAKNWTIS